MQGLAPSDIFQFEDFRLDRHCGGLFRSNGTGKFEPVAIGSRALDILGVLIERAGEVVSKDEIVAAVWPATVVEDSNLTVQISALRRVLDRGQPNGSCIQTVPGRGYRFAGAVTRSQTTETPPGGGGNGEDRDEHRGPVGLTTTARARQKSWCFIAALFVVLAVSGSLAAWIWDHHWSGTADTRPRFSMAVLPFANLGGDLDQDHFVDAITRDLTTDLSGIGHGFVVSPNTAFTYRNRLVDSKQIGRELGVRYLVEGDVRRSGSKVRATAQLIDAETDAVVWAQQFDSETGDLVALEDDITSRIAVALGIELIDREAARPTRQPDTLDYILRGVAVMNAPKTRKTYAEAISLFDRALTLDPRAVEAQSKLAIHLAGRVGANMTDTAAADVVRAEDFAAQAVEAAPRSALAHFAKAQVLYAQNRCDEALYEYETVVALNRNFAAAYFHIGLCKLLSGSTEETILPVDHAIRLSPRDPDIGFWYQAIGRAYFLQGRTQEGVLLLEKSLGANPAQSWVRAWLASAYGLNGETERAATELAEARRLSNDDRYSSVARLTALGSWTPKARARLEATYFAGLRKAGMPEE
jgi:TolB-like protein/DNA-binding winged helix-turn-helix (wHTH) protein/Flp pilus assembly protein TadD